MSRLITVLLIVSALSVSASDAAAPILAVLNRALTNGSFTFYGAGGRGACGLDVPSPEYTAAISGSLFDSSATWVPSTCSDARYVLNDPICNGICARIAYTGSAGAKSLTVQINNMCPECAQNWLDLSPEAFNYLEPLGGTVGHAYGATITYLLCNSTSVNKIGTPCPSGGCCSQSASSSGTSTSTARTTTRAGSATSTSTARTTTRAGSATSTSTARTTTRSTGGGSGSVRVQASIVSSYSGGMQIGLTFTNSGSTPVCKVSFSMVLASGQTLSGSWNMESTGTNVYALPSWTNIAAGGGTFTSAGLNVVGSSTALPTVNIVSSSGC